MDGARCLCLLRASAERNGDAEQQAGAQRTRHLEEVATAGAGGGVRGHDGVLPQPFIVAAASLMARADARVGAAPADVAAHGLVDLGIAGGLVLAQQCFGRHQLAGLAVAALRDIVLDPRGLQGVRRGGRAEGFHGGHGLASNGGHGRLARADRLAINLHGAGPALRSAATKLRTFETDLVANDPQERRIRLRRRGDSLAIQIEASHYNHPPLCDLNSCRYPF